VDVETAQRARFAAPVSASPIVNDNGPVDWPIETICDGIDEMVGGVLVGAAVTVNMKLQLVVFVASLTFIVIVALPVLPAAGVTVTVRFAPLPPNTIFAVGTKEVEEEVPETIKLVGALSESPMVNGIGAVDRPAVVVCEAMIEIVGGVFVGGAGWTVKVKAVLEKFVPSPTVTVICADPI